jgi:BMFP domain-containing protein YqiC
MCCGLAYTEFVALNTYMIQKTRKEKEDLEQRTIELENKVVQLESLVQQLLEKNNN